MRPTLRTSAVVSESGLRQLDRPRALEQSPTEEDVRDLAKLSRIVGRLLSDVAQIRRRFWPRTIDFESQTFDATGTTEYSYHHGFAGRVRYWVVEASGFSAAPNLLKSSDSDANTLILTSTVAGTATLRIQEAG